MINGKTLRDAMISASNCLNRQRQAVDELNIFPVPDGDTGTNMSMTITAAAQMLRKMSDPTVSEVAEQASSALLRGARGNSGVILSLLFRGFAKGLRGRTEANGVDLANALSLGVEAAYKAVMKPTEGTILTVAREAAERGCAVAAKSRDAIVVFEAMCKQAEETLQRTPDMLPVLKKAGVVDAGGQGLCIILNAMLDVFKGGEVEQTAETTVSVSKQTAVAMADADIRFAYCTEFIVARRKGCDLDPLRLRAYLESIGDCVVVVDDDEIIKVHVHTNEPGKALNEGQRFGEFETVKVENMRIQHANAGWVGEQEPAAAEPVLERQEPQEPYGFVAVAAGDGVTGLFTDLGCQHVVSGGQTMNPSTDDILKAIKATPAKVVYVLPNNKNIILAAEQAIPLADREVYVLQTRTIPQGIAAMLAFDPDSKVKENLKSMMQAAENVSTGTLTFAARDSNFENKRIKEGDILALANGKLSFTDSDIQHAAVKLTKQILSSRRSASQSVSFVTLIYGEGVNSADAEKVREAVAAKCGNDVDVTVVNGGQPVYYYYISVE